MAKYLATPFISTSFPHQTVRAIFIAVAAMCAGFAPLHAQNAAAPTHLATPAPKPVTPVPTTNSKRLTSPAVAPIKAPSKPEWSELTTSQQQALSPLAATWPGIDEVRKRKWLAISQNFASLPAQEQARMHSRMKEWVALSPQERVQARLNFAGARELPSEQRLEKWEAYQSLPPEQRQHLAATAPGKPTGAATAVKPMPLKKLAVTPPAPMANASAPKLAGTGLAIPVPAHAPKIAAGTHQVDSHTLLPIPQIAVPEASKQP